MFYVIEYNIIALAMIYVRSITLVTVKLVGTIPQADADMASAPKVDKSGIDFDRLVSRPECDII